MYITLLHPLQCPFHGVIIPRDEHGYPVKTSSESQKSSGSGLDLSHIEGLSGLQSSSREARELWRDIELQSDILAAATLKPGLQQDGAKKRKGEPIYSIVKVDYYKLGFGIKIFMPFCNFHIMLGVPEQALGYICFGIVIEDKPSEVKVVVARL